MTYKRFHHNNTVANTFVTLYTVPAGKKFVFTQFMGSRVNKGSSTANSTIALKFRIWGTELLWASIDTDDMSGPWKWLVLVAWDTFEVSCANVSDVNYDYTITMSWVEEDA